MESEEEERRAGFGDNRRLLGGVWEVSVVRESGFRFEASFRLNVGLCRFHVDNLAQTVS